MGEFKRMDDGSEVIGPDIEDHTHEEYVPIATPVEITAIHTFKPRFTGDVPFKVTVATLIASLNADLLDGFHASDLVQTIVVVDLEVRVAALEAELAKIEESNELLRRILAEVTKQSVQLGELSEVRPTDQDVKEVWQ